MSFIPFVPHPPSSLTPTSWRRGLREDADDVRRPPIHGTSRGFPAFDMQAIAEANQLKQQQSSSAAQSHRLSRSQTLPRPSAPSSRQILSQTSSRFARSTTPPTPPRAHPLSYSSMRPQLIKTAYQQQEPLSCPSQRPSLTFSSPPAVYPYRFLTKPDYLLPHMAASLSTRRDPPKVVPNHYTTLRETWQRIH